VVVPWQQCQQRRALRVHGEAVRDATSASRLLALLALSIGVEQEPVITGDVNATIAIAPITPLTC
jgi:hypothetical protein